MAEHLYLYEGIIRYPGLPLLDGSVLLRKTMKFFITSHGIKYRQKTGKQPNVTDPKKASFLDITTIQKLNTQHDLKAVGRKENYDL